MVAYIVGMVTGAVCMVMPLVYAMNVNTCVSNIMASHPEFDATQFAAYTRPEMLYAIAGIGAFVLILSTILMAVTGFSQLKSPKPKAQEPAPQAAPEPQPVGQPEAPVEDDIELPEL